MTNFFNLILDTTAPTSPTVSLEGGSQYATNQLITASISTADGTTTGYQMKLWGDVDVTHSTDIQDTEAKSKWVSYATSKQLKLSAGDGSKKISIKIRDDVHNESAIAMDSIIVDTTKPIVTVTQPDVGKISKVAGKNVAAFSFTSDSEFDEFKVKVVSSTGSSHDTGVLIGTTGGSVNMGDKTKRPATVPVDCQVSGADLEAASSGDGQKIIKVFVKDLAGNWSA